MTWKMRLQSKIKAAEIVEEAEKDANSKAKEIEIKSKRKKAYQIKRRSRKRSKNMKNEIAQKEARIVKKKKLWTIKLKKIENKSLELEKISERIRSKRKK